MHLSAESADRFYMLMDGLTTYFMQSLNPADFSRLTQGLEQDQALMSVRRAMWSNPTVIDRFLADDVFNLSEEDKSVVKSWKNVLSGQFFLVEHGPLFSLFLSDDMAFGVKGLSCDIQEILPTVPALVTTTLVPFEGDIVYDIDIEEYPMMFGEQLLDMVDTWKKDALAKGLVCSGDALATLVPSILVRRKEKEAENKEMEERLEYLREHPEGRNTEGYHKGALAGLDKKARESAVTDYITRSFEESEFFRGTTPMLEHVRSISRAMEPVDSMLQLLSCTVENPREQILQMFTAAVGDESKAKRLMADLGIVDDQKALERLAGSIVPPMNELMEELVCIDDASYSTLRWCMAEGGRITMTEEEVLAGAFKDRDTWQHRLILFCHDDVFTLIIPKEFFAALQEVDWVKVEGKRVIAQHVYKVMECVTQMCGIATFDEAYEVFCDWYPAEGNRVKKSAFVDLAYGLLDNRPEASFSLWQDPDSNENYPLCYQLDIELTHWLDMINEQQTSEGKPDAEGEEDPHAALEGTKDYLRHLLESHQRRGKIRLDVAIRDAESFFDWEESLPEVLALRDFLDAHVPDEKDDYLFADKVIEEIIDMKAEAISPAKMISILQKEQGLLLDEVDLSDFMDLFTQAHNALPAWELGGVSK